MKIKFYGTRGSIAVANKDAYKYGGNTTCLYIESASGEPIVIDAGTGIRSLGMHLLEAKKEKINVLFTHYHWDHIQGFMFFAPIFLKSKIISLYGAKRKMTIKKALSYQMTRPFFPAEVSVLPANISFYVLSDGMNIGGVQINTIANNHPDFTLGLKFTENGRSFCFLTDNELMAKDANTKYKDFVKFIKGSEFFIHDAQYTDDIYEKRLGWGHSTFNQVIKLAQDAGVKKVLFTHHDHGSTDSFIDNIVNALVEKHKDLSIEAAADGKAIEL
ncbi:hypothetical protein A2Y85_02000 [candidate division WOR-3 bacterium RBG_13_43_14]|uniref:Metallo-beta-lactamase domain-containing protein n=1 Tax=candidate division WOR-3 bacterium RBG_13_43_14 TaxID=1802590 RepID=A0A1F4U2M2_UNCW3|nr:MAG: hypothetical protein A2Y85_02000 [candidate division WOR-3 bacterium RBG_13_43_14]